MSPFLLQRRLNQRALASEGAHECAAFIVQCPRSVQVGTFVFVSHGHRRHGMRGLRERRVKRIFIATEMVFLADAPGLNGDEVACAQDAGQMSEAVITKWSVVTKH